MELKQPHCQSELVLGSWIRETVLLTQRCFLVWSFKCASLFVPSDKLRLLTETNEGGMEASGRCDPGRVGGQV